MFFNVIITYKQQHLVVQTEQMPVFILLSHWDVVVNCVDMNLSNQVTGNLGVHTI